MTGFKSKKAAAQEPTLQEQLDKAKADWDKAFEDWDKAIVARNKANEDLHKSRADWDKADEEINRIKTLMEQQNG
jgi:uncharacterized protein (DUF3084 family)